MKHADIEIIVLGENDASIHAVVDPDGDYEETLFIPNSCIEDLRALDGADTDGRCTISVAKWWLRKNNVPYESSTGWRPEL